jgi:hypothetical protein
MAADWSPPPAAIVDAAKRGEIVGAFPADFVEVALAHPLDNKSEEAPAPDQPVRKAAPPHDEMGGALPQAPGWAQ